jgi:hypothetical protein
MGSGSGLFSRTLKLCSSSRWVLLANANQALIYSTRSKRLLERNGGLQQPKRLSTMSPTTAATLDSILTTTMMTTVNMSAKPRAVAKQATAKMVRTQKPRGPVRPQHAARAKPRPNGVAQAMPRLRSKPKPKVRARARARGRLKRELQTQTTLMMIIIFMSNTKNQASLRTTITPAWSRTLSDTSCRPDLRRSRKSWRVRMSSRSRSRKLHSWHGAAKFRCALAPVLYSQYTCCIAHSKSPSVR